MMGKAGRYLLGSFFLILLAVPLITAVSAQAMTSGAAEFDWPFLGTVYSNTGGPISFTVPQTVLLQSDPGFPFIQNSISTSSIDISFIWTSGFTAWPFNGEVFKLSDDTITSISVTQNMGAVVTFDAEDIYVNFENLAFTEGVSYVNISVTDTNTAAVPEPRTVLILGSGLVGLAGYRRFKKA